MGIRQHETIKDLQAELEAANDEIRRLREQREYLRAQVDSLHGFAMNLFYLHPPLKDAYYGWASLKPKYEYVAALAEAKRHVETLSSAELAKIDRYLETVIEEAKA